MNPCTSPRAQGRTPSTGPSRSLWRFFICSAFFYPVWFVVGGAISIGGSEWEGMVDAALLMSVVGASVVTFLMGVAGEMRNALNRKISRAL